jgi:hypothetical protein
MQSRSKPLTFFCRRTTLVHFFSSSPSYFFRVASSKLAGMFTSSRNAAAVLGAFKTPRYATMALFLSLDQHGSLGHVCKRLSHSSSAWRSVRIALIATMASSCTSTTCNHHAQQYLGAVHSAVRYRGGVVGTFGGLRGVAVCVLASRDDAAGFGRRVRAA